jgi:hypothetical protein
MLNSKREQMVHRNNNAQRKFKKLPMLTPELEKYNKLSSKKN